MFYSAKEKVGSILTTLIHSAMLALIYSFFRGDNVYWDEDDFAASTFIKIFLFPLVVPIALTISALSFTLAAVTAISSVFCVLIPAIIIDMFTKDNQAPNNHELMKLAESLHNDNSLKNSSHCDTKNIIGKFKENIIKCQEKGSFTVAELTKGLHLTSHQKSELKKLVNEANSSSSLNELFKQNPKTEAVDQQLEMEQVTSRHFPGYTFSS